MEPVFRTISGEEFLQFLKEGEQDGRYLQLEPNFILQENRRRPLQFFLDRAYSADRPLVLSYSSLVGFKAPGIRIPHLCASYANFENADLSGSFFYRADFHNSNFASARLQKAYLDNAILSITDLTGTHLEGANCSAANFRLALFTETYLNGTILTEADLRSARELDNAFDLGLAYTDSAIVNEVERRIIEEAKMRVL